MTKDMTSGNPIKLIILFSIPLLIGNAFQQLYSMVDTIIVGREIGVNALAAVGATGGLSFLVLGFVSGFTSGFSIITSQLFGANDYDKMRRSVTTAIILCVILTLVLTVISTLLTLPLLRLIQTPSAIIMGSYHYIVVIFAGMGAIVFYNMIAGVLRALGDSRTPLYCLIVASILNIILDIVFIKYVHLGIAGAAYATVLSQLVSAVLCLIYIKKKFPILKMKKGDWKLDKELAKEELRIGIPMGLQFSITAIGSIIIQAALNQFGATAVAATTAASRVEDFAMLPLNTFAVAMSTFAAQNLGAGKIDRIKEGTRNCLIMATIVSVVLMIIMIAFAHPLIGIFLKNPTQDVLEKSQVFLNITAPFFFFLGLLIILRTTLQGLGASFVTMVAGVSELVMRTLVAFTVARIFGYAGICFAGPVAWIGASIPLIFAYKKRIRYLYTNLTVNKS